MRTVLLVVDLEGVAGVESASELSATSPGFARGRRLLTEETLAAVRGLRARGVERIRVSDSHRPGSEAPTIMPEALGPGVELTFQGDAYAPGLLDGVDAVACLGMHAAAGTGGFAAHTVSVSCAIEQGGSSLSETDLVLALAAEQGVPLIFVTGDDVLGRTVDGPAYVVTKTALSPAAARSRPISEVLREIAGAAAATPVLAGRRKGDLTVLFKSRWMAEAAGGERVDAHRVRVAGTGFREAYARAIAAVAASDRPLGAALRLHDPALINQDVTHMLLRDFPSGRPPPHEQEARRALSWFLDATAGAGRSPRLADRALVLHMLEAHAPRFFATAGLEPMRDQAMVALASLPTTFPIGLDPAEAMARLDGLYLLSERGAARGFDAAGLGDYVRWLAGDAPVIWAWLMAELMAQLGLPRPLEVQPRALREQSRIADIYWITHLFFLYTRYLSNFLPPGRLAAETEELCLAVPEVLAESQMDVAAEIAISFQVAGEDQIAEHHVLLAALRSQQLPDGRVVDPSSEGQAGDPGEQARLAAHVTGAALIAFARTVG